MWWLLVPIPYRVSCLNVKYSIKLKVDRLLFLSSLCNSGNFFITFITRATTSSFGVEWKNSVDRHHRENKVQSLKRLIWDVCAVMRMMAVRSVREECSSPLLFITFLYKSSGSHCSLWPVCLSTRRMAFYVLIRIDSVCVLPP